MPLAETTDGYRCPRDLFYLNKKGQVIDEGGEVKLSNQTDVFDFCTTCGVFRSNRDGFDVRKVCQFPKDMPGENYELMMQEYYSSSARTRMTPLQFFRRMGFL